LIAVVVIAAMAAIAGYLVGALLAGIRQRSEGSNPSGWALLRIAT
jgi:hypothetical protein